MIVLRDENILFEMDTVLESDVLSSKDSELTKFLPQISKAIIESEGKTLHAVNPILTGIDFDSSELELRKYDSYEEFRHSK